MAKGKWDFLREKYKRMPLEATQQERIDAVLQGIAPKRFRDPLRIECLGDEKVQDLENKELKDFYVWLRKRADNLEAKLKALKLEIEAVTREFVNRMDEDGATSISFSDGVSIGCSVEPYPFVTDDAALKKWLKDNDMESMLTLNYGTMASLVKERLEGKVNEPLPDGVDVFMKDKLACRGRGK